MRAPNTPERPALPERAPLALAIVGGLVTLKLLAHLVTNAFSPYEFHRDAFLYMAMGEHLRLFTMDFPPGIAILSQATRGLLGDSLFALRLPIALFSSALALLAALTARELGGSRFAQGLAVLAVLASPLFLRTGNLFQPVVLDQFWWTLGLFALVKLARTEEPRWWIVFGIACGLGLLSKFSMLIFGFAVFLALLVTPGRRAFLTRWPWIAAAIAVVLGSPSFIGQIRLGWPLFDQMGDLRSAQLARVSPLQFILDQPLMGLGFFKKAVEFQKRFGRDGQTVGNGLQTNGLLIDEEWCTLLRDTNFLVGLSLDGPQHVHDHYRADRGGKSTWQRVMESRKRMLDNSVEVNALTVVNEYSARFPGEIYELPPPHAVTSPLKEIIDNRDTGKLSSDEALIDRCPLEGIYA